MEGQRVLIVEDCYLMADTRQDIFTAAGATIVGAANGTALRMIEALQIDMACLDVNLGCETSFPLGDKLTSVASRSCSSPPMTPTRCRRSLRSALAGLRNGLQCNGKCLHHSFLQTRTPGTVCLLIDPAFQSEEAAELLRAYQNFLQLAGETQ